MVRDRTFRVSLLVSILLHLSGYLVLQRADLSLLGPSELRLAKLDTVWLRLVEVPEEKVSEIAPEDTNLISDKSSLARDNFQEDEESAITNSPRSEGVSEVPSMSELFGPPAPGEEAPVEQFPPSEEVAAEPEESPLLYAQAVTPVAMEDENLVPDLEPPTPEAEPEADAPEGEAKYRPPEDALTQAQEGDMSLPTEDALANALRSGEISYSVKEHEFGPYLLEMRERISAEWYPLVAFNYHGLWSAKTVIEFKILPSGDIADLEVVQTKGDDLFETLCVTAVRRAAPFDPISFPFPDIIKDEFINVRYTFRYN